MINKLKSQMLKFFAFCFLLLSFIIISSTKAHAQVDIGTSFLGAKFQTFGELVSSGLNFIFGLAFAIAFFLILFGGIRLMTGGGDEKAVAGAKGLVTSALVGLVLIFVAYWIVKIVERLMGLEGTSLFL